MTPAEVLARHTDRDPDGFPVCCECEQDWVCDAVDQARQLQEAQERVARRREVHIVMRYGDLEGVVAVHATADEAFEDWDARTGHGSRPDLAAKYGIEHWIVQDKQNALAQPPGEPHDPS
jgi:hypothetical protein